MGQRSGGKSGGGENSGGKSKGGDRSGPKSIRSGTGGSICDDPIRLLSQKYSGGGNDKSYDSKHLEMFKKYN